MLGVLLAVAAVCAVLALAAFYLTNRDKAVAADGQASRYPLTAAIDEFRCPSGLTRIVLRGGVEDGFAPAGDEPFRIDPQLLRNGYYADLAEGTNSAVRPRGYDQGGSDRILTDYFTVPTGIVSGALVIRMMPSGAGSANDGLRIGNLDILGQIGSAEGQHTYAAERFWSTVGNVVPEDGSTLVRIDFAALPDETRRAGKRESFLDYLGRSDRRPDIDLTVGDDTKVDSLALLACQLPGQQKGTTLSEHRIKTLGEGVSWLSCGADQSQRTCDPFAGDRLCSAPGPLACYRDGGKVAPQAMWENGMRPTSFVGGEVRLTPPVRGDRFAHLGDANAFCQQQFGREWRVLSYHEGGGGDVVSYSRIAPLTRALVNIRDQQYGNCWDRDVKR
ncbi:hypothetical protein [Novosphingobium sp.]|uniref:hypothetical protein n=1 Tax=Novosphingobium sp. TaxID=1874826 RepID=UPI00286E46C9|nr:hypothetical protein [Novosphingobium sp.]